MAMELNMHEIIEFMTNLAILYLIMHDGTKFWEKPIVKNITEWIMLIFIVIVTIRLAIKSAITRNVQVFLHGLVTKAHIGVGGFHCDLAVFACVLVVRHVVLYPLAAIQKVLRIYWSAPVGALRILMSRWNPGVQDPSAPSCICSRRSSLV